MRPKREARGRRACTICKEPHELSICPRCKEVMNDLAAAHRDPPPPKGARWGRAATRVIRLSKE